MVSASNGVATTPMPLPKPALAIPKIITASTAHTQNTGE
jgi:hypothetical protein